MKALNKKMEERLINLRDTLNFIEPSKVPVNLQTTTGAYGYSGKTLKQVLDDPIANAAAYTEIYEALQPDISTFGINVMAVNVFEALGITKYYLGIDDTGVLHKQAGEEYYGTEFYETLQDKGLQGLAELNEEILRQNIPVLNQSLEEAVEVFKIAAVPQVADMTMKMIASKKLNEMGIPRIIDMPTAQADAPFWMGPFSSIMDTYRGMKEALLDLRRRPDAVKEACDIIAEAKKPTLKTDVNEIKKDFEGLIVPLGINILNAECFLSRKNFERFYLCYFKEQLTPYIEAGAKIYVFMEGKLLHTCDMYQDLPKGSIFFQTDEDDPFEMYEKLGNYHTICTGAPLSLLKCGSKQECIDYAKKCFDTFAPGGGYIFMHNKALTCANDVNFDNMRAVYEFANEYGRK